MSILRGVDWSTVRSHFDRRVKVSNNLLNLFQQRAVEKFTALALGIEDDAGNYSAAEHPVLKVHILGNKNVNRRVFELAGKFIPLKNASQVPELIRHAQLNYLQIGVGSEMSCMVNPEVCWVCNVRTVWTHLAWERSAEEAERALKLYRERDPSSDMAYMNWADVFHPLLRDSLIKVAEEGGRLSRRANVMPGNIVFLWADAIASEVYSRYHP